MALMTRAFRLIPVVMALTPAFADAQVPAVTAGDVRVVEGHTGVRQVSVLLTLSAAAASPITLTYATTGGTAAAGGDYGAASGTIAFAAGATTARFTVDVIGDRAIEPDETFTVVLGGSSGATFATPAATVTIVNDDVGSTPALRTYEVRLHFQGMSGFMKDGDCPGTRRNGTGVLTGLVSGNEAVPRDDDIDYTGLMQLEIDLDLCEVMRSPAGEDMFCTITAVGSGVVQARLDAYVDDRGGYLRLSPARGSFASSITGNCDRELIAEERKMFPFRRLDAKSDSIATTFNGVELLQLPRPLRPSTWKEIDPLGAVTGLTVEIIRRIEP
jgi:hypothetical protein